VSTPKIIMEAKPPIKKDDLKRELPPVVVPS